MARRLPSQPPNLPGFSFIRILGSGGFADVFLYEQNLPRRQVAVKVLLSDVVTHELRQMFQAEANLMAQLSSHPSILTIHQAGVSADGRPYLVMELCSPTLGQRYRAQQLPVAEVLRIGVKVASAVETAHRAGVLHRDIKPSNILTTAYGHPVLSDFGIAATRAESPDSDTIGLSIPWSAPEVLLDESNGTVASEVYSLAATVYTLLAGRSPFEVEGGENGSAELVRRITRGKLAPIGRADVPASLEALLRAGLARKPDARQHSVLELARQLQSVETELGYDQTPLEVAAESWVDEGLADPADRTVIVKVAAAGGAKRPHRRAKTVAAAATSAVGRSGSTRSREVPRAAANRRLLMVLTVACAVLLVAFATTVVLMLGRPAAGSEIPTVRDVSGSVDGGVAVFRWSDPGLRTGDSYQVTVDNEAPSIQRSTEFRVDAARGEQVCVVVAVNRDGKTGPPSAEKCVLTDAS